MQIKVKENQERLDKYLANNTDYSRATISKMLENDYIEVNGKKEKPSYKVKENDLIEIKDGFINTKYRRNRYKTNWNENRYSIWRQRFNYCK